MAEMARENEEAEAEYAREQEAERAAADASQASKQTHQPFCAQPAGIFCPEGVLMPASVSCGE